MVDQGALDALDAVRQANENLTRLARTVIDNAARDRNFEVVQIAEAQLLNLTRANGAVEALYRSLDTRPLTLIG